MTKLETHITESNERFSHMEEKVDDVAKDVKTVMTNHLPHIKADTERLDERSKQQGKLLWWIMGLVAGGTVGVEAIKAIF